MATEFEVSHPLVIQLGCIGQIALTVTDLAEAKRFYGETLGMKFLFDAGTMAFFQCGDSPAVDRACGKTGDAGRRDWGRDDSLLPRGGD